jgi:putative signal transducing protein
MAGPGNPEIEWVGVLETSDRIQFALAKGLLEDAGIPVFVQGQLATLIQDVNGFLHKRVRLVVPGDREAEAREVLGQLLRPLPVEDDQDTGTT